MSASEKLKALGEQLVDDDRYVTAVAEERVLESLPQIVAVVEARERRGDGVDMIRALGFIGNAHYCPGCLNHFHDDLGQHEPGCEVLADMKADDDWWSDRLWASGDATLAALEEVLS